VKHDFGARSRMWAALASVERRTGGRRGANGVNYRDDRSSFIDELAAPIDEADELLEHLESRDATDGQPKKSSYFPYLHNDGAHRYSSTGHRLYRENPSLPYVHLKYLDLLGPPVPGYREMPPWVDYDKQRSPAMPPRTKAGKQAKVHKVMKEFQSGTLRSGSSTGPKVQSRKQAVAIALSEAGASRRKKK
jgi:hypothetical protein